MSELFPLEILAKSIRTVDLLGYDLRRTLTELEGAARALRTLADYLERHPEALLKGKPASAGSTP